MTYKQAMVMRSDLGMGKGKLAAQCAHASLEAYGQSPAAARREWEDGGQAKIVLTFDGEAEILKLFHEAKKAGLPAVVIRDAGHTQVPSGSVTALAIGPAEEREVGLGKAAAPAVLPAAGLAAVQAAVAPVAAQQPVPAGPEAAPAAEAARFPIPFGRAAPNCLGKFHRRWQGLPLRPRAQLRQRWPAARVIRQYSYTVLVWINL